MNPVIVSKPTNIHLRASKNLKGNIQSITKTTKLA